MEALFSQCGIVGDEGWDAFSILLKAVGNFASSIFIPVNLELQRDPFVGQLGHKLLVMESTACEVLRAWETMSRSEQCAIPREVIVYAAVKLRSFWNQYQLAATAARFCVAWSPMLFRLANALMARFPGCEYWPDLPYSASDLESIRGDVAKLLIRHILSLTNARGRYSETDAAFSCRSGRFATAARMRMCFQTLV
jgi:hypothetical protein